METMGIVESITGNPRCEAVLGAQPRARLPSAIVQLPRGKLVRGVVTDSTSWAGMSGVTRVRFGQCGADVSRFPAICAHRSTSGLHTPFRFARSGLSRKDRGAAP